MYPKGDLLIPAPHGHLEAILREPHGDPRGVAIVCHPHPMGGGTMHNKVVFRAASGLLDAGLITLRFNFRGVGASTGVHSEVPGGMEDVRTAIDFIESEFPGSDLTLAGFSFGSRTGMAVGIDDDSVTRLISIGTPVDKYGDYGLLLNVRKPILFVHGDKDEFGDIESLRSLVNEVAKVADAELVEFDNCGHFFEDHLDELRETVRNWEVRHQKTSLSGD
jgi:alpha/beta superfamily hydrolase